MEDQELKEKELRQVVKEVEGELQEVRGKYQGEQAMKRELLAQIKDQEWSFDQQIKKERQKVGAKELECQDFKEEL